MNHANAKAINHTKNKVWATIEYKLSPLGKVSLENYLAADPSTRVGIQYFYNKSGKSFVFKVCMIDTEMCFDFENNTAQFWECGLFEVESTNEKDAFFELNCQLNEELIVLENLVITNNSQEKYFFKVVGVKITLEEFINDEKAMDEIA
ncbi:hypothetical protein [Bacillus badius]|uniref:hypothetical protein n=1 Tax=Bacillus badius TaxID=1455 RepID=UPI000596AD58|nr:hypothetical protein [Bacillus badius]